MKKTHHSEPGDYRAAYDAALLDCGYTDKYLDDLYTAVGVLMRRNAARRNPKPRYNPTPVALRYLRLARINKRQEDS